MSLTKTKVAITIGVATIAIGSALSSTTAEAKNGSATQVADVVSTTGEVITESEYGGVYTTIASMSLNAGSWVLSYHASVIEGGASSGLQYCAIQVGGTRMATSTININTESVLSNAVGVNLPAATDVELECAHGSTGQYPPAVDLDASLVAHRSKNLRLISQ